MDCFRAGDAMLSHLPVSCSEATGLEDSIGVRSLRVSDLQAFLREDLSLTPVE